MILPFVSLKMDSIKIKEENLWEEKSKLSFIANTAKAHSPLYLEPMKSSSESMALLMKGRWDLKIEWTQRKMIKLVLA
jgi:hypothetical protein